MAYSISKEMNAVGELQWCVKCSETKNWHFVKGKKAAIRALNYLNKRVAFKNQKH